MTPAETALRTAEAAHAAGRLDAARALYEQALRLSPALAGALHGLGVLRAQQGARDEAIGLLRRAVAAAPGFAAGWRNLGHLLLEAGQPGAAAAAFRQAVARGEVAAHGDLGAALRADGQDAAARDSYARAVALAQRDVAALAGLGRCLAEANRHAEAVALFGRAAALEPEEPLHRWNSAISRLSLGDFALGWAEFEARWALGERFPAALRAMKQPRWTGAEPVAGRRVLLWAEQGFGDTLQFVRYAPLLAERGARVLLEAPGPTRRLLARLPGVELVEQGAAHDLHCPLMSLPLAFGTTLASVPAATPYLSADPAEAARWRGRLAGLAGLKVGLVWAGSALRIDQRRSVHPARLAPLWRVPGVAWVSLQKGPAPAPEGFELHDWTGELDDFAATAALIEGLDLVISVDTAVAHLAGALGKPVWLLNRFDSCWRWLLGRDDSPWYPSLRQFRQPGPGDWEAVAEAVAQALARRVHG